MDHPAVSWRRAGLSGVTRREDGPGLMGPGRIVTAAEGALGALRAICDGGTLPGNGGVLLGERARLLGLSRGGKVSANGSCRILGAGDGEIAVNLAREGDWELLPALVMEEGDWEVGDWGRLARAVRAWGCGEIVARGRALGLAIAANGEVKAPDAPFVVEAFGRDESGGGGSRHGAPVVVDLSSLWAGPLAGGLMRAAGARVIKVESVRRPDGARMGNRRFFDLLNGGKESVALDFSDAGDLDKLRALIARADIVIESSRPRAMEQLGIYAADVARRGATWVSITAYGREGEKGNYIGYGDDTAFAAGLCGDMRAAWGETMFVGDAIADPLTGIHAAFAGWASWVSGGGTLVSLALADVVAYARTLGAGEDLRASQKMAEADMAPLYEMREPLGVAREMGADNWVLDGI